MLLLPILSFSQSKWEIQRDNGNIKVWTMNYPDSDFKQFKAEVKLKADLENVVALLIDIENMNLWYHRIESVELVSKISETEGTYKIDFDLPWPIANRVSTVRSRLLHDTITNVIKIFTKFEPNIPIESESILVNDIISEWILTPERDGYLNIFHSGYLEPAGSLPAWIMNLGVKDGPINSMTSLVALLANYENVDIPWID